MNKIILKRVVRLGEFIDDPIWSEAYMTFDGINATDLQALANLGKDDPELVNKAIGLLSRKLLDAKLPNEKQELVNITKGEVITLPIEVIYACLISIRKQIEASQRGF